MSLLTVVMDVPVTSGNIGSGAVTGQMGGGYYVIASGTIGVNDIASGVLGTTSIAIGGTITGGSSGAVLYVGSGGNLQQDPPYLMYDGGNHTLVLGSKSDQKKPGAIQVNGYFDPNPDAPTSGFPTYGLDIEYLVSGRLSGGGGGGSIGVLVNINDNAVYVGTSGSVTTVTGIRATAAAGAGTYGASGNTMDLSVYGVNAVAIDSSFVSGAGSHTAYAVFADAQGNPSGQTTAYGIYARASGGNTNWAGYFAGDVAAIKRMAVGSGASVGTGNQLLGVISGAEVMEYKSVTGSGITITQLSGRVVLSHASGGIESGGIGSGVVQGFFGPTRNIASGTVGVFDFGSGAVIAGTIASGAVRSGNIASGVIGTFHLADSLITSGKMASGSVYGQAGGGPFVIASGTLGSFDLASGAVISGRIASGQVGFGHLANASVQSGTLASGQVFTFHIASGGLLSGAFGSGQIAHPHLGSGAVLSGDIASGQIGSNHIASGQLTGFELGSGAIVSGRVASGQIGFGHLANASIQSGTLASGVVSTYSHASGDVAPGAATVSPLVSGGIWTATTAEGVSGVRAVSLTQSGTLQVAMASVSGRMPAIGVVVANVASGIQTTVYDVLPYQFTSGMADYSGYLGRPLYVGRSGSVVTSSGSFNSGGFLSGDIRQTLGAVWNSGAALLMVLPDDSATGQRGATKTEMQTATSPTSLVVPSTTQHHPGVSKAWVNFDGTLSGSSMIRSSYNVTSITKNSTGDYTVNITTQFSGNTYVPNCTFSTRSGSSTTGARVFSVTSLTSGAARFAFQDGTGAAEDQYFVFCDFKGMQ